MARSKVYFKNFSPRNELWNQPWYGFKSKQGHQQTDKYTAIPASWDPPTAVCDRKKKKWNFKDKCNCMNLCSKGSPGLPPPPVRKYPMTSSIMIYKVWVMIIYNFSRIILEICSSSKPCWSLFHRWRWFNISHCWIVLWWSKWYQETLWRCWSCTKRKENYVLRQW